MSKETTDDDLQWDVGVQPTYTSAGKDYDTLNLGEQKRARYKQDTHFRRCLAIWVMHIVPLWLFMVMIVVVFYGVGWMNLSDTAIVTLLATTTANVLGLAYIVLKGIFPEGSGK